MKNPWIIPVVALAVGAVGGFLSGKGSSGGDSASRAAEMARENKAARGTISSEVEDAKRAARADSTLDAMNTPGHTARVKALLDFYAGLSPEQLAEEANKLENMPMSERIMASFLLFGRWAEVDPMAAMAAANGMGMAGGFVRPTVLRSWASVDPENAAKYYAENPREFAMMGGGPGGMNGAASIASEWAKQDPTAAMAWAGSLEGRDKAQAMTSVVREVALTDPKKAAELAGRIDAGEREDAYDSIARQWGAKNFIEAEAWVKSLPADEQGSAMAEAIAGLAQDNPTLAKSKVEAMPPGEDRNDATEELLENLSRENPKDALSYLQKLEDPKAQEESIRDVISNLTLKDNAAARQYIDAAPSGEVRDTAVSAYVMSDNSSEPKDLMQLAETIEDEGDRGRTMGMAGMRWMREDPEAAKTYVQQSTAIPDQMKERFLSGREFGRGRRPR